MAHIPEEALDFLKDPDRWPLWPLLPIKRSRPKQGPECALMFASGKPEVIFGDLYALDSRPGESYSEKFAGLQRKEYPTFEAMVADGWRPD